MKIKDLKEVLHLHVIVLIDLTRLYPASCCGLHSRIGSNDQNNHHDLKTYRSNISRSWILMNCRQVNSLLPLFLPRAHINLTFLFICATPATIYARRYNTDTILLFMMAMKLLFHNNGKTCRLKLPEMIVQSQKSLT